MMASSSQSPMETSRIGASRPARPRPGPLSFPRDRAYGTAGGAAATAVINGDVRGAGEEEDHRRGSPLYANGIHPRQGRRTSESTPLWSYVTSPQSPIIQLRDHCHQQWVAVLFTVALLMVTFYVVFGLSAPMRADRCITPFGTLLGENSGAAAYSNCRVDYAGDRMDHFVSVGLQRLYTGSKWHSLEYARRYWILTALISFAPFSSPGGLLTVETVNAVNGRRGGRDSSVMPLQRYFNLFVSHQTLQNEGGKLQQLNWTGNYLNGSGSAGLPHPPNAMLQPRDLIVYAKNAKTLPLGHVAVVVAVRGPFPSVTSAGKEVQWYITKNASARWRQPLSPNSKLAGLTPSPRRNATRATGVPAGNAATGSTPTPSAGSNVKETAEQHKRYYKVFVAEQNWDNTYWASPSPMNGLDSDPGGNDNATLRDKRRPPRKAVKQLSHFTRVLLLHEYTNEQSFFLEDTHNNVILGWVRAPADT